MSVDPAPLLAAEVRRATTRALGPDHADVDPMIRRSERADYQADLALGLARRLRQAPQAIAQRIAQELTIGDLLARVDVAGGYLNLTLQSAWLDAAAARALASDRLAVAPAASPERVMIDYSAPNVAKEIHVGHLRTTIIGDALARVLELRGHTVLRQNHLGDWGTPFGMLIEHMIDLGADSSERELALGELGDFYRAARKQFDSDKAFADRSRRRVVELQRGDPETLGWWRTLVELSARAFQAIYTRLGITLTEADICGESFYNDRLPLLVDELVASGSVRESEGAIGLFPAGFLNKEGGPLPLIVRKTDGGYGYASTDLAAIRYRLAELRATRLLYVVGAPQATHLAMIFTAATELGWLAPPARAEHVAFGTVLGKDGKKLASREGAPVRLVDLIDQAIARADLEIHKRSPDLPPDARAALARIVGVGAIKYADLSNDRIKDYVFDLDRMVTFVGDTAGYAQYAHARIRSILRDAAGLPIGPVRINDPHERALVLALLGLGNTVALVEHTLEPHRLTAFVRSVALAFTSFYEHCPVLKSDGETRASRLAIIELTARTLALALGLLGIEAPERM